MPLCMTDNVVSRCMIILVVGTAFFVATTTFVLSDHPNPCEHLCDLPSALSGSLAPKIMQLYRQCYARTMISRMGADTGSDDMSDSFGQPASASLR
jgi:hypothetical protein